MFRHVTAATAIAASTTANLAEEPFAADVWSDNWFEMRINGERVVQDSVPITTERSFNAESSSSRRNGHS